MQSTQERISEVHSPNLEFVKEDGNANFAIVVQVGIVCGPLLGGLFTEYVSWRWCRYAFKQQTTSYR